LDRVRVAELSIVALKPAWIEVRGSDGTIFRSRTMARGEVYYPRMDAGWTVTARNPNACVWALDGEQIMPMGQADSPIYSLSVDTMAQQLVTLRREQLAEATQD
jgi:ribulose-5-phosphate 4-epimerase/fuculose-1-phosphate aldolase